MSPRGGGRVNSAGAYDHAPAYLGLGDLAVSAKLSTTEANGKLYNYMACGLPVVASDTPVNRELLGDHGVYASPGDASALRAEILAVLDDPEGRRTRGRALRVRATAEHSWERVGEQLADLYRELLAAARNRRGRGWGYGTTASRCDAVVPSLSRRRK